jgi:hypothetical protein
MIFKNGNHLIETEAKLTRLSSVKLFRQKKASDYAEAFSYLNLVHPWGYYRG